MCVSTREPIRFPSVLLQPLGHLSVQVEQTVYREAASRSTVDCAAHTLTNLRIVTLPPSIVETWRPARSQRPTGKTIHPPNRAERSPALLCSHASASTFATATSGDRVQSRAELWSAHGPTPFKSQLTGALPIVCVSLLTLKPAHHTDSSGPHAAHTRRPTSRGGRAFTTSR